MPENKTDQKETGKSAPRTRRLVQEIEGALREQGMDSALAVLEELRERDRAKRSMAPARRVTGRKMTSDLAQQIVLLYQSTNMTQQEIAFKLGVNQGRVNEVIKRAKWLSDDPQVLEAVTRDEALEHTAEYMNKDEKEAALRHFAELCETLETTASLLHREVADDLRERRAALAQMSETQDTIQKKIDEANAWLARRAG